MSTDVRSSRELEFYRLLLDGLRDAVADDPAAPFSAVRTLETEESGRAVVVEGGRSGRLVVEVVRDTVQPSGPDVVERAGDRAREQGAGRFATCNSNDCFLFGSVDVGEPADLDFYYLNLRGRPLAESITSILEAADHLDREGALPAQSRRERLVGTLRSVHGSLWPALKTSAADAYECDPAFAAAFDGWVDAKDYGDRERSTQFAIAAKRYAHLLTSRVLFDEVARRGDGPGEDGRSVAGGSPLDPLDSRGQAGYLDRDGIATPDGDGLASGDRRPDRAAERELFASFPRDERTQQRLSGLARTVAGDTIDGIEGDPLGAVYEECLTAADRKSLGQFYTPPAIAETLVRWALRPPGGTAGTAQGDDIPRVLDPAAGSGTFVVEAYRHLAERFRDASHRELIDHLLAVDVNRVPLHLTALNLASQRPAEPTDRVHAYHASFFDLEPGVAVGGERADGNGDGREERVDGGLVDGRGDEVDGGRDEAFEAGIGPVDAVVGNPPYVEAADLRPDLEHFRDHLRRFGPGDATPYADGERAIGANADAYVYFVTQATRFLREGGRLGFVLPTKWMTSRYGAQFQRFLHDHYAIEAVVGFDARAFEDALVDTALVLLERRADDRAREENVVEFVQLHGRVDPGTVLDAIDRDDDPGEVELAVESCEAYRSVRVRQSSLVEGAAHGKIGHYLVAPGPLLELVESPDLVELGELADVRRGAMTGSTAFFFPDEADVEAHGIEDAFLRPALKSMRGHDTIGYEGADVDRWFVDVHGYVEDVRERADDRPVEERVKRALEDDGYTGLLSWIRHAEEAGEHRGATCGRREVWFDFGEPPRPEILFQKLLRERLFSIYNGVGAVPSNAVDCIDVHDDVDSKALFGVLNSSVARAVMEVWGRNEAGMLQLMTYETRSLPVPDVRSMAADELEPIRAVVDEVLERGQSDLSGAHRDRLDAAVCDAFDRPAGLTAERIQEIQRSMLERRIESGETGAVLTGEGEDGGGPGSNPDVTR